MTAVAVHMAKAFRDAAVRHRDRHLVQRFRHQCPEIPVIVGAAHPSARVAFDRAVEIGKARRIAVEEDRRIVADNVPVAVFGIELERKAADVALGVGGTPFAGDLREAGKHRRLFADLGKDLRLRKARDVASHGEGAVGAPALCMHTPFGDHLAVENGPAFRSARCPAIAPGRAGRRS